MENLKRNWLKAITAFTLVLCLVLGVRAFENKIVQEPAKAVLKTVYFIPSTDADAAIQNEENWTEEPEEAPNCNGDDFLCQVQYDETAYPTLAHFLSANPTRAQIELNASSVSYKN